MRMFIMTEDRIDRFSGEDMESITGNKQVVSTAVEPEKFGGRRTNNAANKKLQGRLQKLERRGRLMLWWCGMPASDAMVEKFTCNRCSIRFECNCVFDVYNIDGDCLMEK